MVDLVGTYPPLFIIFLFYKRKEKKNGGKKEVLFLELSLKQKLKLTEVDKLLLLNLLLEQYSAK